MEWLENLSKAIEYIEANLDNTISFEEAARIACCSTYYFQRMFSYVYGGVRLLPPIAIDGPLDKNAKAL